MSVLTAQLEKLVANAKRVKSDEFQSVIDEYRNLFDRYVFRLRPSVGSISLVSCANWTPQLGFSNMTSGTILQRTLASLKDGSVNLKAPDRPTPEKSVQSWLIAQSIANAGRVEAIEKAVSDGHSYWFVSDEIALTTSDDREGSKPVRVVADLLMIRSDENGDSELVNVELKSQRTTETHGQTQKFWQFMGPSQVALWREFVDVMLEGPDRTWKANSKSRGIVIWPNAVRPSKSTSELIARYKSEESIDTICYSGPNYSLRPEPSL
ncbi:hypothetical protein BST63_18895 [Bradyrhizobium canariense]|uniref:Uncharacterized protein n=1 Tax=Bradyrhizobium canariense TaxID=255045 RepID=A0ABX3X2R9_9BRAD|nr:hypothetical protein [Bradyrhizobium canariense]OSJ13744.1 hypothetical protein BSR47_19720 [Bradyrhizobium canariense]OSJ27811.1 hypothetical protein BST63_18895 [Bradyrhizobium canariense]